MGFDNAHAISKKGIQPKQGHDHQHSNHTNNSQPYSYINAGKLLEDFWEAVDKMLKKTQSEINK
jgi:hypothetical protein